MSALRKFIQYSRETFEPTALMAAWIIIAFFVFLVLYTFGSVMFEDIIGSGASHVREGQ